VAGPKPFWENNPDTTWVYSVPPEQNEAVLTPSAPRSGEGELAPRERDRQLQVTVSVFAALLLVGIVMGIYSAWTRHRKASERKQADSRLCSCHSCMPSYSASPAFPAPVFELFAVCFLLPLCEMHHEATSLSSTLAMDAPSPESSRTQLVTSSHIYCRHSPTFAVSLIASYWDPLSCQLKSRH
jgi:hypothetical protein